MNRAGVAVGGFSGRSSLPLLLDGELLILVDDDGAEPICDWWWGECLGGEGGGPVTVVIGGWLRSGENDKGGKRAGEGRVKPKKDLADVRERGVVGDGVGVGVAVWVERGVSGLDWVNCLAEGENLAVNTEGATAFCVSRSVFVVSGFSSPKGGTSSSGIGTSVLVRRRRHRVGKCGLRVQHRVRRRSETMKAKATVRRTVVRMIVKLRFPGDWLLDAIAIFVGTPVAVVG